jgi:phosphoribosylformimino-5-aminoimidazole carboxamide ribotide isomerase
MIIPCIDLQRGQAVQLVRGRKLRLAEGNVWGLLDRFRRYPVLQLIDLDAAMRRGSNGRLVRELCRRAQAAGIRVRVGGGIRSVARARRTLDWGAEKIIIGSAAFRGSHLHRAFLMRLNERIGRNRILLALDTARGKIVVHGWQRALEFEPAAVIGELEHYCSGFLCTYVDREGTMRGTNLQFFRQLRACTALPITAAGGIRSRREIRALERLGMDAAVGMAMYLHKIR